MLLFLAFNPFKFDELSHISMFLRFFFNYTGCFFTSSGGLRSFEHPFNELKAVPRVDSSGEMCGANFKVDSNSKKETGMPRVGSAANWSQHY